MHPTFARGCKDRSWLLISTCSIIKRTIAGLACFARIAAAVIVDTSCAARPIPGLEGSFVLQITILGPRSENKGSKENSVDDRQAFLANLSQSNISLHRTALDSTLHAKPRRAVAFRSVCNIPKPLQTIGVLQMLVKERMEEEN